MTWTTEQLAQMARLADECLELPATEREAWRLRMQEHYPDMADAIAAMARARLQTVAQSSNCLLWAVGVGALAAGGADRFGRSMGPADVALKA